VAVSLLVAGGGVGRSLAGEKLGFATAANVGRNGVVHEPNRGDGWIDLQGDEEMSGLQVGQYIGSAWPF